MRAELALRVVALAVWLAVGSPVWTRPEAIRVPWVALYLAFGAAMWIATRNAVQTRARLVWLIAQSVCGITLAVLGMPHFEGALLALVTAQAAWFLTPQVSTAITLLQAIPLFVIVLPSHELLGALKATGEYVTFSLFATLVSYLRLQERRARLELARERAVLLATQSLLEDGARVHERLRLAREVHDAMGHGLTAASVSLQIAARTGDKAALAAAQTAVQTTLAEVRALVSTTRERKSVDLPTALRALAAGMQQPAITLEMPTRLELGDERRAHALFRVVQEAITNAVKHGHASAVNVSLANEAGTIHVRVRDDGAGASSPPFGNGLLGLRERLVEVGGGVEIRTERGKGFELHGWVAS
jgi:signal transduction histidine kinase